MRFLVFIPYRSCIVVLFSFAFAALAANITLYSNDHYNYLDIFNDIDGDVTSRIEPLFYFVTKLSSYLELSFTSYWLLLSFLSFYIKISILEKQKCSVLILIFLCVIYLSSLGILHEITQIRASIAISFGCMFIFYWANNKRITGVFCLLIAIGMHYSAGLFLLSFVIRLGQNRLSFFRLIIFTAVACILPLIATNSASIFDSINPLFSLYLNNSENVTAGTVSVTTLLAILSLCPVFIFLRKYNAKGFLLYNFKLYILGVVFLIVFSFSPVLSIRVYELFSFCLFIIVALLFSSREQNIIFGDINPDKWFYIIRIFFLIILVVISLHRHLAFIYVNPILNFN
ncbi:hypothetical protein CUC44_09665 [Aeromonas lusitana]|uniref:EpsG family protein n=1 Tax=Aeromonas lusitana TaxID=931529 RepID=A0A2M8HAJ8_9GAMM|nr:hypothetical protein CUC44_09665 [Aeromonas lusitana]